jgi:hypothetical protein
MRSRVGATAASDSLCAADAHFAPALNLVVISTADLAYVELLLRGLQPWLLMLERNIPVRHAPEVEGQPLLFEQFGADSRRLKLVGNMFKQGKRSVSPHAHPLGV